MACGPIAACQVIVCGPQEIKTNKLYNKWIHGFQLDISSLDLKVDYFFFRRGLRLALGFDRSFFSDLE